MSDDLARVSVHESGHGVAAVVLKRSVRYLSIRGGKHFAGVAPYAAPKLSLRCSEYTHLPSVLWPASLRRALEVRVVVSLAGRAAELAVPHSAYTATQSCEKAAVEATSALAGLSPHLRRQLVDLEESDEPLTSDQESAMEDVHVLAAQGEGVALYAYLQAVATTLVTIHWRQVAAVAEELLEREVLAGADVRKICLQVKQGVAPKAGALEQEELTNGTT